MSDANLTRLWNVIGSINCLYALNTWIFSQGANPIFNIKILDDRPVPASYFGAIIVSSLLLLLIEIGKKYLKGKEVLLWSERFPTTYLNDVNPRDKLIKTYKGFFLLSLYCYQPYQLFTLTTKLSLMEILDTPNQIKSL